MEVYAGIGERVAGFAERYIVQTKGPLQVERWQRAFLDELFLVDGEGRRVYREALLGVGRKNGKSTVAAAIALRAVPVPMVRGAGGLQGRRPQGVDSREPLVMGRPRRPSGSLSASRGRTSTPAWLWPTPRTGRRANRHPRTRRLADRVGLDVGSFGARAPSR